MAGAGNFAPARLWLLAALVLAACGPIPRPQAEAECHERARLAESPRGTLRVGLSDDGPYTQAEITLSSDYLAGADPAQVYDSCVFQRSGQMPSRPYSSLPG